MELFGITWRKRSYLIMKTEILAPVGNEEMLVAAVRTGTDAVYFGASRFNARRNADNFGDEQLKKAIEYCKLNNVKSYLTLNTVIKDSEIYDALELVQSAYRYGIDAIIVQDLGLAELIHSNFPKLALHASTQMSVHSAAALSILKEMGFCRVVPAREMSKSELKLFCKRAKELNIEVEVFVHGALCMCLSGQCYFSAFLGGRSANRGLCAGTCRLPFNAKGGTGYDLSLKDLSLVSNLNELAEMGVCSFKIEGRMKRPEYVASAVTAMRQMVDKGYADTEILCLLEQVFSREGFTSGYYDEKLGRAMFGIRSEQDKMLTNEALAKIHILYRNERQKIPLKMILNLKSGNATELFIEADDIKVTVLGDIPQVAVNVPLSRERAAEAISKLGGTCYFADDVTVNIENGLTLPVSALNKMRKEAVSVLNSKKIEVQRESNLLAVKDIAKTNSRSIKGFFARFATLEQLLLCKDVLLELLGYSLPAEILKKAFEDEKTPISDFMLNAAYAELPRGAASDESIKNLLKSLKKNGIKGVVCSNISGLQLAKEQGFDIMGGFGLNLFNTHSVKAAEKLGVERAVISPEMSFNEICGLGDTENSELFSMCYGRQPLMLTRNCPVRNGVGCGAKKEYCTITDRKKQTFPVICRNGFSEILNCKITDVSDSLGKLKADGGYLYFTIETPEDTLETIKEFLNNKARNGEAYTRGLFKSGVL